MRDATCRRAARLMDKLAAEVAFDRHDRAHLAACARCRVTVEKAAWFDSALERLVPSLATEPIPQAVLAPPADQRVLGVLAWHRPLLAVAAAAVGVVVAVSVSGQVADLITRSGPFGSGASITSEPTPVTSHTIDCGTPTGPGAPVAIDVDDLGGLPRVAIVAERGVVTALFAAEQDVGHVYALCAWFTDQTPPVGSGSSGAGADVPADGPLRLIVAHRAGASGEVWTAYAGAADAEVSQVRVALSDGSTQVVQVSDGYFAVAWQGEAYATGFTALGDRGESLHTIGNAGWDFSNWRSP